MQEMFVPRLGKYCSTCLRRTLEYYHILSLPLFLSYSLTNFEAVIFSVEYPVGQSAEYSMCTPEIFCPKPPAHLHSIWCGQHKLHIGVWSSVKN